MAKFTLGLLFVCTALIMSTQTAPPVTWQEHWFEHNQNLKRVFQDNDVAVYYDNDVISTISWPFNYLGDVWRYTKNVYGSFGSDPALYAVFHSGKYSGGHPAVYFDPSHDNRNVIDVGTNDPNGWLSGQGGDFDMVTSLVGSLVEFSSKNSVNSPALNVWGGKWVEIFIYDVYLALERTTDAQRWFNSCYNTRDTYPQQNTAWFKDWFYPIYNNLGKAATLNNFFVLLSQNFPKSGQFYARDMNLGEFVHFWSGASKCNLETLSKTAFGSTALMSLQLTNARKDFPNIKYGDCGEVAGAPPAPQTTWQEHWFEHNQNLKRVFQDNNVAVYYDKDVISTISWPFKYVGDVWRYTKSVYGTFGPEAALYAVFHAGKYPGGHPSTYFDASHDNRNVIDVGSTDPNAWQSGQGNDLDVITHEVCHIVEGASKNSHNSPAFNVWGDSKWAEIFIYDVYLGLGRTADAQRWYNICINNRDTYPQPNTAWFKDWFYPLYNNYGKTATLNNFFVLLSQNFPKSGQDYTRSMNLGEFIHFWSGAAKCNLENIANTAFGSTALTSLQLTNARKDFPNITYNNCAISQTLNKVIR